VIEYDELNRLTGARPKSTVAPFCVECGYNLSGAVSAQCPECGTLFDRKRWEELSRLVARRVEQLREANEWANHAMFLAVGAACAEMLCWVGRGSLLSLIVIPLACLGGFISFFLGLAVVRAAPWAVLAPVSRPLKPDRQAAMIDILLGAGVIAGAMVF
jgi:hypothetical protein